MSRQASPGQVGVRFLARNSRGSSQDRSSSTPASRTAAPVRKHRSLSLPLGSEMPGFKVVIHEGRVAAMRRTDSNIPHSETVKRTDR